MHLTVIQAFTTQKKNGDGKLVPDVDYAKGDKIHDAEKIEEILAGENAGHVVKTADPADHFNGA